MKVSVKKCEKIKNGYLLEIEPKESLYIDGKGGQLGDRLQQTKRYSLSAYSSTYVFSYCL